MEIRKRVIKRFRRIANQNNTTYAEVLKAFKSQFKFTKEKIEELSKEKLANMSEKELEDYVFNYIYLGKIFTTKKLQEYGNKKNKIERD